MRLAMELLKGLHRRQQGQAVAWMLGLTVIALMTGAIAVDLGVWLRDLRFAQNKADAVVLAAVLELPQAGEASARQVAQDWFRQNIPADMQDRAALECCTFQDRDGDGRPDTVRARVSLRSHSLFARLLGFGDPTVTKPATAMRARALGGSVMPWGVYCQDEGDPDCGLDSAALYAFHWGEPQTGGQGRGGRGGGNASPGNFNALRVDGGGNRDYRDAIVGPGGSSAIYEIGDSVYVFSQPGQMGQTTCEALYQRALNYGEAGVPSCGPQSSGRASCDAATPQQAASLRDTCPGRLVLIPITEPLQQGRDQVRIIRVGTFYIAGWDRSNPYGSGFDADRDGREDMVWGYFVPDSGVDPAFLLEVDPEQGNGGGSTLAPLVAVLIE
ncbi:MAG TPA: Tad domain-containing protein [Dehalococcoidia bacterium]|nr:Tad domain-containing protein [Dehalococcoidia bacterium]